MALSLDGGEAMPKLRAVRTNGDLDSYWQHDLVGEHKRAYAARFRNGVIPQAACSLLAERATPTKFCWRLVSYWNFDTRLAKEGELTREGFLPHRQLLVEVWSVSVLTGVFNLVERRVLCVEKLAVLQ